MNIIPSTKLESRRDLIGYCLLFYAWVVSVALALAVRNQATLDRYDLSATELRIAAAVLLPNMFIWGTLLYAVLSFYRYTSYIAGSKGCDWVSLYHLGFSGAIGGLCRR